MPILSASCCCEGCAEHAVASDDIMSQVKDTMSQAVSLPTGLLQFVVMLFPSFPVPMYTHVCSWLRAVFLQAAWAQLEESENGVVQGAWQTCLARRLMHTCCPPSCRSKTSCTPTGQPHPPPALAPSRILALSVLCVLLWGC